MFPLILLLSGVERHPLMIAAAWKGGSAIGLAVFVWRRYGDLLADPRWRGAVRARTGWRTWLIAGGGELDVVLFGVAVGHADPVIVATVYQSWPACLAGGLSWWSRRSGRYGRSGARVWVAFVIASVGLGLLAMAQAVTHVDTGWERQSFGFVIALILAAAVGAEVLVTIRCGVAVRATTGHMGQAGRRVEVAASLFVTLIVLAVAACGLLVAGVAAGEAVPLSTAGAIFAAGATVGTVTRVGLRTGNLAARSVAVNLIPYGAPVLAACWLLLAGAASVNRLDLLGAGIAAIVAANVLANLPGSAVSANTPARPGGRGD